MAERGEVAQLIHRYARAAGATAGWATSSARMTPEFIIVGAQRAGTTSLYKTLAQHPDVLPAGLHKGIHYFDTSYERSFDWYRGHFPLVAAAALRSRSRGRRPITGEASPYYMFHPLVPARLASDLPGVKVIALLRDPVERAYSAYTHEKARGFESETFEDALTLEPQRLADVAAGFAHDPYWVSTSHQHNAYIARGEYVDQLERLEGALGRDRLLVIDSDDLFVDFEPNLAAVLDFLGLPPWMPDTFQKRNARPRQLLSGDVRARLEAHFEPFDQRLATWWGRTPSWRVE